MQLPIVSLIINGLFLALVICIPLFITLAIIRGARSSADAAGTQKEIQHLLEEILEIEKDTNTILKEKKTL